MTFHDASKEFELDCKVRHLSPKTIGNYTKQLRYLENYLSSEFSVLNIEDVKPWPRWMMLAGSHNTLMIYSRFSKPFSLIWRLKGTLRYLQRSESGT